MEWFFISKEDTDKIREALVSAVDMVDKRCAETGCMCDLRGNPCSQFFTDALHSLDTGLHVTGGAVPADFVETR